MAAILVALTEILHFQQTTRQLDPECQNPPPSAIPNVVRIMRSHSYTRNKVILALIKTLPTPPNIHDSKRLLYLKHSLRTEHNVSWLDKEIGSD